MRPVFVAFLLAADTFVVATLAIARPRGWVPPLHRLRVHPRRVGRLRGVVSATPARRRLTLRSHMGYDGRNEEACRVGCGRVRTPAAGRSHRPQASLVRVDLTVSMELDKAVGAVVRDCLGVSPGEEVLVVCNPATESSWRPNAERGTEGGCGRGPGRDRRARFARRRAAWAGRGGDGRRRRRPRSDRPVALPHRRPQGGQRGGRSHRHVARGNRGDARPGDERRHGRAAPPGRCGCRRP